MLFVTTQQLEKAQQYLEHEESTDNIRSMLIDFLENITKTQIEYLLESYDVKV